MLLVLGLHFENHGGGGTGGHHTAVKEHNRAMCTDILDLQHVSGENSKV